MSILVLLLVVAFVTQLTCAAADGGVATSSTSTLFGGNQQSPSPPSHQYVIHHTHAFHVEPRATINSVLSDIRQHSMIQHSKGDKDGGGSLLDIDVSSNRIDDGTAVSFMEGLLPLLKSKIEQSDDSSQIDKRTPLVIKLSLAMNKITPLGSSNILDMLTKKEDTKEEDKIEETANNGTIAENRVEDVNDDTNEVDIVSDSSNVENIDASTSQDAITLTVEESPSVLIEELDLSLNDIGHPPSTQLLDSVRRLFEGGGTDTLIPRVLVLENCSIGPAFCRSIGRGILNAYERKTAMPASSLRCRPSVLRLGGNSDIGDAGTVALAAALRMAIDDDSESPVLEELDLSSCNVGDAGAEALALALASNPGCLSRLDLSNNKITDVACKALSRAIVDSRLGSGVGFDSIVLDNNAGIGDVGAEALAEVLACGAARSISMRSCSIQAQGMAALGKAVVKLTSRKDCRSSHFQVDVSGNKFGIRKIKKKKSKYSAGRIKDTATTNIKFIGKTLRGAAKRFSSESMGISVDSDDDEEIMGGLVDDIDNEEKEIDDNKLKACGAQTFSAEILAGDQPSQKSENTLKITVGMRQCCLDEAAFDSLAASIVGVKNLDLTFDVSMNAVEDNVVDALMYGDKDKELLSEMAKTHMDFLDRLDDARQRQLEAVNAAAGSSFWSDDEDIGFDDEDDYDFF